MLKTRTVTYLVPYKTSKHAAIQYLMMPQEEINLSSRWPSTGVCQLKELSLNSKTIYSKFYDFSATSLQHGLFLNFSLLENDNVTNFHNMLQTCIPVSKT